MASKVAEDGRKTTAGQQVRVIDIPADAGEGMGIFENLHGFNRPSDLAEALRDGTQRHYGHAARAFLTKLVEDVAGTAQEVREAVGAFALEVAPREADGQVHRVARRFALAAYAGELAIKAGVVPWEKGAAVEAAARCFDDWLRSRGCSGPKEESDALDAVIGFLQRHRSRFCPWGAADTSIHDRAGFVRETDQELIFYLFRQTFVADICGKSGIDPEQAADALARHGYLRKSSDGKNTRSERLPTGEKDRVYVISIPAETEEDDQ